MFCIPRSRVFFLWCWPIKDNLSVQSTLLKNAPKAEVGNALARGVRVSGRVNLKGFPSSEREGRSNRLLRCLELNGPYVLDRPGSRSSIVNQTVNKNEVLAFLNNR